MEIDRPYAEETAKLCKPHGKRRRRRQKPIGEDRVNRNYYCIINTITELLEPGRTTNGQHRTTENGECLLSVDFSWLLCLTDGPRG